MRSNIGLLFALAIGLVPSLSWAQIPLVQVDMVTVGDLGNPADVVSAGLGFGGSVSYEYMIGKYEVTNEEYTEFLNAVDPNGGNPLFLYRSSMSVGNGGINLTPGNAIGSKYQVRAGFIQKPVVYVSFYDCIRFCNWLHNGAQSGSDTENGAYTLLGGGSTPTNGATIVRNPNAMFAIPTNDEWYKAGYYQPFSNGGDTDNYWKYPTGGNTPPLSSGPTNVAEAANYDDALTGFVDVGSYPGTVGYYGTFNMGGNAAEWTERINSSGLRVQRGGYWNGSDTPMSSTLPSSASPSAELHILGFRIVGTTNSVAVNQPPVFDPLPTAITNVEEQVIMLPLSGTDPDLPAQTLTFTQLSGPGSLSSNTFVWTPSETDGPGTFTAVFEIRDNGVPSLAATTTVTLVITEDNQPPVFDPLPATITSVEGVAIVQPLSGTDPDLPVQTLTFTQLSGPGSLISNTFAWTPSETDGPGTFTAVFEIRDNGVPSLAATTTVTLVITEDNQPPVFDPWPSAITNVEEQVIMLPLSGTDPDLPAQTLTFTQLAGPGSLGSNTFVWTPSEADGPGTFTAVFEIRDNGVPSLAATNTITLVITEANQPPILTPIPNQITELGVPLQIPLLASDPDIPTNTLSFSLGTTALGLSITNNVILYNSTMTGTIQVVAIVTDNGLPSASATQTFSIVSAPHLVILDITALDQAQSRIHFRSIASVQYVLETTPSIANPVWTSVATGTATGPMGSIDHLHMGMDLLRFYRVRRKP